MQSQSFQFDLDGQLNIVDFTSAFHKVCPALTAEKNIAEIFRLVAPQLTFTHSVLTMFNEQLVTLCPIDNPSFVFGGAFYQLQHGFRFIGYPQLTNMGQLVEMKLGLNDFVNHDPINFYIGTLQLKESMYQETIKLNQELKASAEHLESLVALRTEELLQSEKMASLGILAAGVAHEINNPVGFLLSNLSTFKDYMNDVLPILTKMVSLSDEEKKQIQDIIQIQPNWHNVSFISEDIIPLIEQSIEGSQRVSKTVAGLRSFAHPSDSSQEPMAVQAAIDLALSLLNNELKHNVTLRYERGEDILVKGNLTELSQVFINLLMNAAQAIEKQGLITINVEPKVSTVQITVTDNGSGISPENLPKLFQPFFTTKEVGTGTGLGLAISHGIIENHDGRIKATSKEGEGTVFSLELPRIKASE